MSIDFVTDKCSSSRSSSITWKLSFMSRVAPGRVQFCFHHPQVEVPASAWCPAHPVKCSSAPLYPHQLFLRKEWWRHSWHLGCSWKLVGFFWGGASKEDLQLLQEGLKSGLYTTCKAGKRKGLFWKEVDDRTTEMLPQVFVCCWVLFCFFPPPTCFTSCGFISYQYLAFSCAKGKKNYGVESGFYF